MQPFPLDNFYLMSKIRLPLLEGYGALYAG
jgi:hypothetical protein